MQIVDRLIKVRFRHDYQTGLGAKIGKSRLPPHPKKVRIEIAAPGERGRAHKVVGETPHIAPEELPASGLSESEVWRRTLAPLFPKIRRALENP